MPATKPSIRSIKTFLYRGTAREWSNRYYLDGHVPSSSAEWDAIMDALKDLEKVGLSADVSIARMHGYVTGSEVPVRTKSYGVSGLVTTGNKCPGDCAVVIKQATTKVSTKNHVVYCFSYFHGARNGDSAPDTTWAAQATGFNALGAAFNSGITVGANTYFRCTPDGHRVTGVTVEPNIGHRDFLN